MPWIREIVPSEAEGPLRETYRRLLGEAEEAPAILTVNALHPEGLEAHMGLYRALVFGKSPLSRIQRESIATVVSRQNDCHY